MSLRIGSENRFIFLKGDAPGPDAAGHARGDGPVAVSAVAVSVIVVAAVP
jgi:hypothetical protein